MWRHLICSYFFMDLLFARWKHEVVFVSVFFILNAVWCKNACRLHFYIFSIYEALVASQTFELQEERSSPDWMDQNQLALAMALGVADDVLIPSNTGRFAEEWGAKNWSISSRRARADPGATNTPTYRTVKYLFVHIHQVISLSGLQRSASMYISQWK